MFVFAKGVNQMINSKQQLKETLKYEKNMYFAQSNINYFRKWLSKDDEYMIYKYIKYFRLADFYFNKKKWLKHFFYRYKKNKFGVMLGISISHDNIGKGIRLWHFGSIIINGKAEIGENCQLHGNNCIGNKGNQHESEVPKIGNNVDIGAGAVILGNVYIADNIKIGANAVVTKSFYEKGIVVAGIPAVDISAKTNK